MTTLTSPEAAFAACEAAGLEPLRGSDHQFGTKYGVFLPGAERYLNFYGDEAFLRWFNYYDRLLTLRKAAGWTLTKPHGWLSPDGLTELEWSEEDLPFPEDDGFADWFSAAYHHEALDNDTTANPWPNATP